MSTPDHAAAVVLSPASATADPDGLGGKGRSLAELVANGLPVPPTGVVTTGAYRAVTSGAGIRGRINSIIEGADVDAPTVDRWFADVPIDADLAGAIAEMARRVGDGGPIAVRSSATVEDLHGSSFAGQYQSLLNVDSSDAASVMDAVRLVWASLWHPAPTTYRRAFGVDESDVAMAVVLMRMIDPTTAGVVFTVDPGGADNAARVESVEGLGEALVSGDRTPAAWVVDRDEPVDLPHVPTRALELALRIEKENGVPQDVEWAAVDDEVFVVQARPITAIDPDDGFDTPLDDHELTTAGIVEMVPGVLPALRWDVNRFLLEEAFRSVLDSLGIIRGSAVEDRPFVRRIRGRAAIDFDRLREAAATVPGAAEELERQYFGTSGDAQRPSPRREGRLATLRRDVRTLRTRRKVIEQAEILIGTVRQLRDRRPTLGTQSDAELLAYLRRLLDLAARGLAAELGVAAAGAAAYSRLETMLTAHLGDDEATAAVQRVAVDVGVDEPRQSLSCAAVFGGPTWDDLGTLPAHPAPRSRAQQRERVAELEERLKSLPGWRRKRILTGQFIDLRVHLIRRTIAEVIEQLHRRETAKAAFLELGGEARRVHLELGRRLVERGILIDPAEVELLDTSELSAALDGETSIGRDALGRRRNWISRFEAEGQLPTRFVGVPDREPAPLPEGDVLEGWAASPGRHRAKAQVIRSPEERLRRGHVLVAEATDASWSPLFVRAGAIVVERGGPLSHAAILARELGLPAVLNLAGATGVLDGATVTVDGDRGLVVIEQRPGDRPKDQP